jgi:hypothetical protein
MCCSTNYACLLKKSGESGDLLFTYYTGLATLSGALQIHHTHHANPATAIPSTTRVMTPVPWNVPFSP